MERRLNAAERLIAGLGSERARWGTDVKQLAVAHEKLVGDCLLAASFLSYCGERAGRRVLLQGGHRHGRRRALAPPPRDCA
jgi:hypothetical protein